MKRVATVLLCLLIGVGSSRSWAVEVQEVPISNGVTALLVEDHSLPVLTVRVLFHRGGYAGDPENQQGRAALAASLFNEGAGDLPSQAFMQALEHYALSLQASVDGDRLSIYMKSLSEYRDKGFELLGLALTEPRFDPEAIARMKRELAAIRARRQSRPGYYADRRWNELAFPGHGYSQEKYGTAESVEALSRKDIQAYWQDVVNRREIIISVAGDINADTLKAAFEPILQQLPEGPETLPEDKAIELAAPGEISVVEKDVDQSVIVFGHRGIERRSDDFFPAFVLNHILGGGGFSSRLMEEVRVKRGLVYGISTGLSQLDAMPLFQGEASTRNEKVGEVIAVVKEQMQAIREQGVTAEELTAAKQYLTGSFPLNIATNAGITAYLNGIQRYDLGLDYFDRRNGYIEAVTREQVNAVAKTLLHPDRLLITVAGKPELDQP